MKNIKTITWVLAVIVFVLGLGAYLSNHKTANAPTKSDTSTSTVNTPVVDNSSVIYTNTDYGFTFSLPVDWKGFSIMKSTWTGNSPASKTVAVGETLLIRNPNWTANKHYEDIPIMVFTLAQWNSYTAGDFYTSAAPFNASEIARNNKYVFALPPRWDYDYSQGYKEAEDILSSKPLHPFNL